MFFPFVNLLTFRFKNIFQWEGNLISSQAPQGVEPQKPCSYGKTLPLGICINSIRKGEFTYVGPIWLFPGSLQWSFWSVSADWEVVLQLVHREVNEVLQLRYKMKENPQRKAERRNHTGREREKENKWGKYSGRGGERDREREILLP